MKKNFALKAAVLMLSAALLSGCGEKPESLIASAKEFQAKNDHAAAAIQLRNALQQDPNVAEARYLLAVSLQLTNDNATAEKELRKAMELGYPDDVVIPKLARLLLEQGRADEVIKEFGARSLQKADAQAELQTVLGDANLVKNKASEARAAYAAALAAVPGYIPARVGEARILAASGDLEGASRLADEIIKDAPQDVRAIGFRGGMYLIQRQYKEAISYYEKMVEMEPHKLSAHYLLLDALMQDGQLDKATERIAIAKKMGGGSDGRLVYQEALLELRKKNYTRARELAQSVLKAIPDHTPSLLIAGTCDILLGAYEPAQEALIRVLNRWPQHIGARRMLVTAYLRLGQADKAVETLQPLLELPEQDAVTLALAGEVYLAANNVRKAEDYLQRAAKLDKDNASLRTRLGQIHYATGDTDAAIEELERASAADSTKVQADMLLVLGYIRSKEYAKATEALEVMDRKTPNNPLTYNLKAGLLMAKGDMAGARAALERALELKPSDFTALVNLARMDVKENRIDKARERFEAAIDKQPRNDSLILTYARFLAGTGASTDVVIAMIERAVKANPTAESPRLALIAAKAQTGDKKGTLSAAQDALAAFPDSARVMEAAGLAQLNAGEVNQSISTFNKLVQAQPRSGDALGRLAQAQMAAKNPDAALESLRKAVVLQPNSMELNSGYIEVLVSLGRYDQALAESRKIQGAQPQQVIGFLLEGNVFTTQKKWNEAQRAYAEALKRDNDNTAIFIKLHRVTELEGRKANADALAAKWLKEYPQDLVARAYLAERDLHKENYKGAVAHYKIIVQQRPLDVATLNNLAWTANQVKDPEALKYAQKALELAPKNPAVLDTIGMMLIERGQAEKGLSYVENAHKLAPQAIAIHLNYARALGQAGKKDQARQELQELAKHSNPEVKAQAEKLLKAL